jgi:phage shock protein PspC (stress-responsive transcriptional regulator)
MDAHEIPKPMARSRDDRWLGGVAGGLAARWGQPAGRIRAAFVVAAIAGLGLGAVIGLCLAVASYGPFIRRLRSAPSA